jgi:hypothetical protein
LFEVEQLAVHQPPLLQSAEAHCEAEVQASPSPRPLLGGGGGGWVLQADAQFVCSQVAMALSTPSEPLDRPLVHALTQLELPLHDSAQFHAPRHPVSAVHAPHEEPHCDRKQLSHAADTPERSIEHEATL